MSQHLLFSETGQHQLTIGIHISAKRRLLGDLHSDLHSPSPKLLKVENFNREEVAKSREKLRVVRLRGLCLFVFLKALNTCSKQRAATGFGGRKTPALVVHRTHLLQLSPAMHHRQEKR